MLHHAPSYSLPIALMVIPLAIAPAPALAQDAAQEESPPRVVAVTTFDVPYTDRSQVWSFMRDYYLPAMQLHPAVLNLRVMTHLYGSGGAEIIIMREMSEWADVNSPCGAPCEEYREKHPAPEEGSPGYEEFAAARSLFQKYYSDHRDEIYTVIPSATKIEGRIVGRVGPPTEAVPGPAGGS